jgi:hypothetical protein
MCAFYSAGLCRFAVIITVHLHTVPHGAGSKPEKQALGAQLL